MNLKPLFALLILSIFFVVVSDPVTPTRKLPDGSILLEDFQNDKVGDLPANWFNRNGDRNPINYEGRLREEYQYSVREEGGRKFLRYEGSEAKHLLLPLGANEEINIRDTPVLSWQWRVHQLPQGANEDRDNLNDTAVSIYVVWGFNMLRVPRVVRYTWSSTLPVGFEASKNMNMQKLIVVASGVNNLGTWQTFERDIVEDYRNHFRGSVPRRPVAILILSDADNTNSFAKADYDMIKLRKK